MRGTCRLCSPPNFAHDWGYSTCSWTLLVKVVTWRFAKRQGVRVKGLRLGLNLQWRQCGRGVTRGGKGGTILRALIHYGGAESLQGRWITAGGAEKSQQCHKYFLQYSKFVFERTQIWPKGRQTSTMGAPVRPGVSRICFVPRAPYSLVTPLHCKQEISNSLPAH